MPICIRVARSAADLRALFEVRHRVFVDEERVRPPTRRGAIVDLYDALPTTANLCALVGGEVVGGVRVTIDSPAGLPADDEHDFRAGLPKDARLGSCGQMCLRQRCRDDPRSIVGLLRMCAYWAVLHGCTHLCGIVNPTALELVQRMGFEAVGATFRGTEGLPSVPVLLDVEEMAADYVDFAQRQGVGLWMEEFERWLYLPGEALAQAGDDADGAYLLVEGQVALRAGSERVVERIGRGHVFGELALVSPGRRTHTAVSVTHTEAMYLSRRRFQQQLRTDPQRLTELVRALGTRFEDTVGRGGLGLEVVEHSTG